MGKFIHVDRRRVQSAMRRHAELLKNDDQAQEQLRLGEERDKAVRRERDRRYRDGDWMTEKQEF